MDKTKKVVINTCFGGFGLSDEAYEKLIEWGIPARKYEEEVRNPKTGLYDTKLANNEGEVIFDRTLTPPEEDKSGWNDAEHIRLLGRYWETWLSSEREHPLLVRVVEELGEKAFGRHAKLKVVEIPANVDYEIDEYDGNEHIAETHQTWS